MADPPISRNASSILSNSPPPEYLNEADLFEFPLIRATNLYTDEGYEHQSDMTNDEESPGPSRFSANLNEVAELRPRYFFHRNDHSDPSFGSTYIGEGGVQVDTNDVVEESPNLPTSSTSRNQIGNEESSFGQRIRVYNDSLAPQLKCTICQKRKKLGQTVTLSCGCDYCKVCLERRFTRAIEAEYMFPAACCDENIDLALVRQVLSQDILRSYETKTIEFETTDRTYCANRDCFAFISKETIEGDKAVCSNPTCHTMTCVKCKGEWHKGDCSVDEALQLVLVEAEKKGWKRCTKCAVWKTCRCGQEDLDQILRVTHRYPNNEYRINDDEGNNNDNDYLPLHLNRRPRYRGRCNGRVNTTDHLRRHFEDRIRPARNEHMSNSVSNASPLIFDPVAQYQAPDTDRARHFTESLGPPSSVDENSNTFMNTWASPIPKSSKRGSYDRTYPNIAPTAEESVKDSSPSNNPPGAVGFFGRISHDYVFDPNIMRQFGRPRGMQATGNNKHSRPNHFPDSNIDRSFSSFHPTSQNLNPTATPISHEMDQTDQHTRSWPINGMDVEAAKSSRETLSTRFAGGMKNSGDFMQNIGIGVDSNNPIVNIPTDDSLDAQNSLSVNFNYNYGDENDANNPFTPTPINVGESSSNISRDNETESRLFEQQFLSFTAPTHSSSVTTSDEQTPVQHVKARRVRRRIISERLEQAWGMHGYMPNLDGHREYD
ncbi:hypothetical protein EYC80_004168 [Monilinia laxa]|uniref:IBR domain-containing protein n=1 Tax=Monilinia laxa TaxID=61186 RepID=A0A5N6KNY7_MONLA|nr:hypothetical protein EYC80_004168 [Monilinia laxa]